MGHFPFMVFMQHGYIEEKRERGKDGTVGSRQGMERRRGRRKDGGAGRRVRRRNEGRKEVKER